MADTFLHVDLCAGSFFSLTTGRVLVCTVEHRAAHAGLGAEHADIEQRAAQQYRPVVDDILRTGSRDVQHIEHTLDDLLGFCGHEPAFQRDDWPSYGL